MSDELQERQAKAAELLDLHDRLDRLDEKLRAQKTAIRLTTLVSIVLAAPPLIVLFLNHVRFFLAYPSTFVMTLAAILYALVAERRRLKEEREGIKTRIREMEEAPPPEARLRGMP